MLEVDQYSFLKKTLTYLVRIPSRQAESPAADQAQGDEHTRYLYTLWTMQLANVPRWLGQGGRNARVLRKQERDILRGTGAGGSGHLTVVCHRLLLFLGVVSVAGSDPEHVRTGTASIIEAAYY